MRYQHIKTSILEQFKAPNGNKIVPFILGAPGGGKSACARDVVQSLNIDPEKVIEFNASLRDPVDILGLPSSKGDHSDWLASKEFWTVRRGQGRAALILEELSDGSVAMQNALCRVIYDRHAGQLPLSDELFIIATGNRTEDKSGANRITSKLANRTRRFEFTENLDDWTEWALDNNLPAELIQFMRFRPGLLSEFDPNRFCNPTPRSWERVACIPDSLPEQLYFDNVAGEVGEGAAAEYTGFRRIYRQLPNIDALLLDPKGADVPDDPAVRFAITGALARKATKDNFDRITTYTARLPKEFDVMTVKDSIKLCREVQNTRSFVEWATRNAEVLM
ncbi:MAG: hypothetical protein RJA99_3211 [Pseudomonadota bacterium]|jgi:hypothetical protein